MADPGLKPEEKPLGGAFPQTAWTLVQQAVLSEGDARAGALNELAARYWQPIYIFIRRSGRMPPDAEDLTQAFFIHLLEKNLLDRVRLREVRFRAFLRSVLENFLANTARTTLAKKRFAGFMFDVSTAENWLAAGGLATPADAFENMWAIERLEAAFARLRSELRHAGREWVAEALLARSGFGAEADAGSVRDLSRRHGVSENQLSVAMHRARERLRQLLVADLCSAAHSPEEAEEDLAAMFSALGRRPI